MMKLPQSIMIEREKAIERADEKLEKVVRKHIGRWVKEEKICNKPDNQYIVILLMILLLSLFAMAVLILVPIISKNESGGSIVLLPSRQEPPKQIVEVRNVTNEIIKEKVVVGQTSKCYKLETTQGVNYVCEQ